MNIKEMAEIAKSLAPIVKQYVSESIEGLKAQIDVDGKIQGLRDEFKAMIDSAVAQNAPPAIDYDEIAKSLDLSFPVEEVSPLIDKAVAERTPELPDIGKMVEDAVAAAMANIEPPKDGKDADPEEIARMIDEAVSKIAIKSGRDGEDGRDALDLDVLPAIDPEKSYQRGEYATHNGGLWRSHSKTHGMRGWECVVDGLADLDAVFGEDPREVTVRMVRSSGAVVERSVHLPVVVDMGAHSLEVNYQKGDGVSYSGSFWIAQKDNPEGRPGTNNDWRLAVKKGRDVRRDTKS